jgi:hypothetical protein
LGNLKDRDHLEGLDIVGRIIFKWILKKENRDIDWVYFVQDRDKW